MGSADSLDKVGREREETGMTPKLWFQEQEAQCCRFLGLGTFQEEKV